MGLGFVIPEKMTVNDSPAKAIIKLNEYITNQLRKQVFKQSSYQASKVPSEWWSKLVRKKWRYLESEWANKKVTKNEWLSKKVSEKAR